MLFSTLLVGAQTGQREPLGDLTPEAILAAEQVLDRNLDVEEKKNLVYGKVGDIELLGDLYLPKGADTTRPGMLMIHGGGWAGGDKSEIGHYRVASRRYASMGFVVFNVNYRLSGIAPAPAAVEDVKCALRFMHAHAADWKMDSARVVTAGGSAGSHLALMAGFCDDPAFSDKGGWPGESEQVAAVLSRSAISDVHDLVYGKNQRVWAVKWLPPSTPDGETLARRVSPRSYATRDTLPAVYAVHGMEDDVVPVEQAMNLHVSLLEQGHWSELFILPFTGHGATLKRYTEIQPDLNQEINLRIADFFLRTGILGE